MRKIILAGLLILLPNIVSAQILKSKAITTAAADCTLDTTCVTVDNLKDLPSISVGIAIGTTGTLAFESTEDDITWRAAPDDVTAATTTTANGAFYFSNPGYLKFRVRASAISGTVTVTIVKGYTGLRSTATLTGGGGDGAILDGVSAAIKATVFNLTNSKALSTQIVDGAGTAITSFGGGTQYTNGASTAANPIGTMPVFDNAGTISKVSDTIGLPVKLLTGSTTAVTGSLTNISGTISLPTGASTAAKQPALGTAGSASTDVISVQGIASMTPLLVSLSGTNNIGTVTAVTAITNALPAGTNVIGHVIADTGSITAVTGNVTAVQATGTNLHVVVDSCTSGCSSSSAPADNTAFTAGTTPTLPVAGFYHATRDAVTDGRSANFAINAKRGLFVTPEDSASASLFGLAAAGADNVSNPTLGGIFAYTMCWDSGGSNWDRCGAAGAASTVAGNKTNNNAAPGATNVGVLGGIANAAAPSWTEGNLVNHSVDLHGSTRVLWMDSAGNVVTPEVSATTNTTTQTTGPQLFGNGSTATPSAVGADGRSVAVWTDLNGRIQNNINQINGVTPLMGNGTSGTGVQRVTIASDSTGIIALAAGSALVGQISPVATAVTTNTSVPCYITSAASTNSTNCKASAGNVYSYQLINTTATLYYLRMYNLSSAPTCSSATGFVRTIPIPASATGAGITIPQDVGEGFATGIGFCLTGGGSSTDNTNAATGVYVTILYK